MSIRVPNQAIEIIPAGNYVARCYSMIHIGTVSNTYGNDVKLQNRVLISWELPTLLYEHEEKEYPSIISKEYTLTMGSKGNLRKDLESWRGKAFTEAEADDFDLTKLLGAACMLNIIHKTSQTSGNAYANISSISRVPEGLTCPQAMKEVYEFNYDDKFSTQAVEIMPEFIRNKVMSSQEYLAKISGSEEQPPQDVPEMSQGEPDDDLPF